MQKQFAQVLCAGLMLMTTAVAPVLAETPPLGVLPIAPRAPESDAFDKEMMVQNWILCTSEANAESIARARADGVEPALKAYAGFQTTKSCGLFPVLKVILRQSLYQSAPEEKHATRVYRASVNLGQEWPTGFVIYGGLAE